MTTRLFLIGLLFTALGCVQTNRGNVMNDEQEIRKLYDNWIKATTEGDLELARQCIADDAKFFVPMVGTGVMDKESFAKAAAGIKPEESPIIFNLDSKLKEIKISGNQAYLWIESTLVMTPKNGDSSSKMAGHSLSILEKRDGKWLIVRDANTLTTVAD